jgi:hypothetical protein
LVEPTELDPEPNIGLLPEEEPPGFTDDDPELNDGLSLLEGLLEELYELLGFDEELYDLLELLELGFDEEL